jgi:hypothetical protein
MQYRLTGLTFVALGATMPVAASAQTIDLTVTIPKLTVAEYHKPYVAIWLEKEGAAPRTVAVWYEVDRRGGEGTKWLRDIRQWWRASGRGMSFPADGVSGATRGPGAQKARLGVAGLAPGNYTLLVEAAREVGGRELVRVPFAWNGTSASGSAKGAAELGAVSFTIKR